MFEFSMDAHMHFDLYENRDKVLEYIESKKSYTIAVTNLPELFQRYDKKYADKKFVKIALGFHRNWLQNISTSKFYFIN